MPKPRHHALLGFVPGTDDDAAQRLTDALPEDPLVALPPRRICPECDGLDGYHAEECPIRRTVPHPPMSNGAPKPKQPPRTIRKSGPSTRAIMGRLLRELADRIERG
jgi:hypothetical protein